MRGTINKSDKNKMASFRERFLQFLTNKTTLSLLLLVSITLITHWRWFFLYKYFSCGDSLFLTSSKDILRDQFSLPYLWSTRMNGLGGFDVILPFYPIFYLLFGVFATFGLDVRVVAKLLYFIPTPLLATVGSYFLIKHIVKSNLAGIVGALVYSYNVYFILSQAGTITLAAGYALAPLVLLFLLKTLETRKIIFLVLTGITGFVESAYEFRFFYIVAWVMLFLIVYYALFVEKVRNGFKFVKRIVYSLVPFILIFFLNLYWILPFYKTGSISSNEIINRGLFGDQFMNWQQSVTFFHPFWTGGRGGAFFVVQPIPFYFWLIPIFALIGVILNRKNKLVIFFTFVSLLGILLTKQSGSPFPGLYLWLYNHFPGFNAYRESSKFYVLTALGYSVLISGFISVIQKNKNRNKLLSLSKYSAILLIAGLFLWNSRVLITGDIGCLFSGKDRPVEYDQIKDIISKSDNYFRTLWIPQFSAWSHYDNKHPMINLYTMYFNTWGEDLNKMGKFKFSENKSLTMADISHQPLDLLTQDYSNNFLDTISVKYIIVPARDNKNDDDMFANTGLNDREYIINLLDNFPYLKKINNFKSAIDVYENKGFKPLIYVTDEREDVFKIIQSTPVNYSYINPTEYKISLNNINKPIFLNFNNSYSSDWKIFEGNIDLFHLLLNPLAFQVSSSEKTNLKFNSFYIDPDKIRKSSAKYTLNKDGSINMDLALIYYPQIYVYVGSLLSIATLSLITIYLAGKLIINSKRSNKNE